MSVLISLSSPKKWLNDNQLAADTLVAQLRLSDGSDFPLCAATSKHTNPKLLVKLNQAFTEFMMQRTIPVTNEDACFRVRVGIEYKA